MALSDLLNTLASTSLSTGDADLVFEALLSGALDQAQIAGVLSLLAARGPTADELVGAATAMRRHVTPIPASDPAGIIDTCGTGGAPKTFNVSTAAALVAAAAGARVAKHGNRSRTGRGSAEVLQALGVNVDAGPAVQARCLDRAGVCFCFAIHHHPAMRHAAPIRRALMVPTIFNVLGPLVNPARATRQLIGVYDEALVPLVGTALSRLGSTRAMVVHARDGLDEISITAPTLIAEVGLGGLTISELDPRALVPQMDLSRIQRAELVAADVSESARFIREVLDGTPGPRAEMVILNAAAALVVAGLAADFGSGAAAARAAIEDGRASATLALLVAESHAT